MNWPVVPDLLASIAWGLTVLACLGTLAGFLGRIGWLGELASHFRAQYLWMLAASAAVLVLSHQPLPALLAAAFAVVNAALILPVYRGTVPASTGRVFRALSANLWIHNRSYERVKRFLREADADLMVLLEVTDAWRQALQEVMADYHCSTMDAFPKGMGVFVLSRAPFERMEVVRSGSTVLPSILVRVRLGGRPVTLIGSHPRSPTTPARAKRRNRQLAELAGVVRQQEGPVLVLGDLNSTSWSGAFQEFLRATRLRDSRRGFGLQPTWPAQLPWLRIPIDHCLVSSEIVVHRRRVGRRIGSDHLPIVVDFSLAA